MSEKVGLTAIWYLLSNWDTTIQYLEEYLPIAGAIIEQEFTVDVGDAIDNGELKYSELNEGLQALLDMFVDIEWPDGINYSDDDLIEVMPDHIWITFPGTELVLCDLLNAKAFFESIAWDEIGGIAMSIFGSSWEGSILGWFFHFAGDNRVPWTHKLKFKDGVSGIVGSGESFFPEKNITWGQVEPYVIKATVIGLILYVVKKTGLVGKVWKALKGGNDYRTKRMMRATFASLTEGQLNLEIEHTALTAVLNAKVASLVTLIDLSAVTSQDLLNEINQRLGLKLIL